MADSAFTMNMHDICIDTSVVQTGFELDISVVQTGFERTAENVNSPWHYTLY